MHLPLGAPLPETVRILSPESCDDENERFFDEEEERGTLITLEVTIEDIEETVVCFLCVYVTMFVLVWFRTKSV